MEEGVRLAAFDLEIANEIPDGDRDWVRAGPIGISFAALVSEGAESTPGVMFDPRHSPELFDPGTKALTREGAGLVVQTLTDAVARGFTLVTWNGLGFDFQVLAAASGLVAACAQLATESIDMMFQVVCVNGYRLSLDTALAGMGLANKMHTATLNDGRETPISGKDAPRLWQAGEYQPVMDYCVSDARQTLALALECQRRRCLTWTSKRGRPVRMDLGRGWLTVRECLALPEPDTSWMTDPVTRRSFTSWMDEAGL